VATIKTASVQRARLVADWRREGEAIGFMGRFTPAACPIFQKKSGFRFLDFSERSGPLPLCSQRMNPSRPHPGTSLLTRPTLLYRVRKWEDGASWEEFHRLYRRLVYGRARRAGLAHADAEDVAQDVFKRVAETIKDFDLNPERGSFRGWLMQLTHWRIADKFESLGRIPAQNSVHRDDTAAHTATIERVPALVDDEDEWDREWQQHILSAAVERLARQVKPRHFQVFELYVRQQWPVLKVAAELGINPASVYVIGHRLTKLLKTEAQKLQQQLG
jgi:RNA polymerase sigma factor (sigma-70 family)